jgi:hypothetical protein
MITPVAAGIVLVPRVGPLTLLRTRILSRGFWVRHLGLRLGRGCLLLIGGSIAWLGLLSIWCLLRGGFRELVRELLRGSIL